MQRIIEEAYSTLNSYLQKGGNPPCQQCKGSGKIVVTMNTLGKENSEHKCELSCISCSGQGQFVFSSEKDYSAWVSAEIERKMWCVCEFETQSDYIENNQCKGCIIKHHYHCKRCHLITQIG